MNVIEFVKYYDSIKPTVPEIKESTSAISNDISDGILKYFDLHIIALKIEENPIMDLIENSNICETGFSKFHFYKSKTSDIVEKIGMIEENGYLFLNKHTKKISFEPEESYRSKEQDIDQEDFLIFFLKYLQLEFNRVFRKKSKDFKVIDAFELNISFIKKHKIFEELLNEIGVELP